jgi:DNA replication protein DnaC
MHCWSSQLPVEHWHAWIGDATIADAILDRIMQRNHRFTLTGDSLRAQTKNQQKGEKYRPIVTAPTTI